MKHYSLVKCGKMFDGILEELQPNMEILIEDNRIAEIGRNLPVPEGASVHDLSDCTVTPGLIDAHVHMQHVDCRTRNHDIIFRGAAWKGMSILYTAKQILYRGFTTARSAGSSTYDGRGGIAAREMINAGYFPGARLCMLPNYLYDSGSHGDHTQYLQLNPELCDAMAKMAPTCGSGVDFFRHVVRDEIKLGADYIKMMVNGGFSTPNDGPDDQQLSDEEMQAIIDTTHQYGKTCTAHIYNSDQMKKLVNMGIDGMEHGSLITEDTARLMEDKGTYLVPTFCPYEDIINLNEETLAQKPPAFATKLRAYAKRLQEGRRVIVESNMRLGYGTDIVTVWQSYDCGREYEAWMKSGMKPFRILKAATMVNAGILQMDKDIGSIEVGKLADLSGWRRDLMTDPKALFDCAFVMKDGVTYPTVPIEE